MLGKDIYCAEEAVFGKGGWGVMGRGYTKKATRGLLGYIGFF